jgi:myo-inositol-1(or 4)-monophosphatase
LNAADETAAVLALAQRLAREAGHLQRERYESDLTVGTKSAPVDLVTEVDRACEALVVEGIARERPGDGVLAEEGSARAGGAWRWVVDPLDGTTNYAHGYPRFCVSIGVEHEGRARVGVVYDPLMDELYHAARGAGAFCNGRALRVSAETALDRSLLATGFAYDRRESEVDNVREFAALLKAARALRRDGSAALDLCYVAAGRLDGYWEFKLQPWDVSAGALVVEEAGGRVSDLAGGDGHWSGHQVVASNGRIHAALLDALRRSR